MNATLNSKKSAIVVLSGGQDSATCLLVALFQHHYRPGQVLAVSFDYGQRHAVELECAAALCRHYNVDHVVLDASALRSVGRSNLSNGNGNVRAPHPTVSGVAASFVPMRNALFLTLAYGVAIDVGADIVFAGMCQTDDAGYPDCRKDFVCALNYALNIGYSASVLIDTPLMELTKQETFALADKLGGLDQILALTHTCYEGDHVTPNPWGFGCGQCPSCALRARGYYEFARAAQEPELPIAANAYAAD